MVTKEQVAVAVAYGNAEADACAKAFQDQPAVVWPDAIPHIADRNFQEFHANSSLCIALNHIVFRAAAARWANIIARVRPAKSETLRDEIVRELLPAVIAHMRNESGNESKRLDEEIIVDRAQRVADEFLKRSGK